jgi:hypothetical protein
MKTNILVSLALSIPAFLTACTTGPTESEGSSHSTHSSGYETKVQYDSNQLLMKNSEQIGELVKRKIQKAQSIQAKQTVDDDRGIVAEPEAIEALEDATRIVLSRPDQDGTVSNMISRLRRELTDLGALDEVLENLTTEAIAALRSDSTPTNHQYTYIVILENMMAELRPEVGTNPKFHRILERIRDADLELSDEVAAQQRLRSMTEPVSPSVTAAKILPKKKK